MSIQLIVDGVTVYQSDAAATPPAPATPPPVYVPPAPPAPAPSGEFEQMTVSGAGSPLPVNFKSQPVMEYRTHGFTNENAGSKGACLAITVAPDDVGLIAVTTGTANTADQNSPMNWSISQNAGDYASGVQGPQRDASGTFGSSLLVSLNGGGGDFNLTPGVWYFNVRLVNAPAGRENKMVAFTRQS